MTSLRSGGGDAALPPIFMPAIAVFGGALAPIFMPDIAIFGVAAGAPPPIAALPVIDPVFCKPSKICSGGVKLKSASNTTTSCWSGRSR